ncbi:SDR family oxidoreductase [Telmatospirillum sp. J64-1]|uniref:SDR family oxidoreductase n=1 Tax=Telmatospirillum sp. J64-1 TaxID=2502183 RepID=UPI00115C692F|nr:SDR family oxidoreductase [Telmatospirillum sp. J64-1]
MTHTWFITGASSGFGRLIAERVLERGDSVAATYRRSGALDDLAARYPDRLWTAEMDLRKPETIAAAVEGAFTAFPRIDRIISNAGFGTFGAAEEVSEDQVRHQIEGNLIGTILFIRRIIPRLRENGGGRILQVTSEGGRIAYPAFSLYHASKWGQEGFLASVAQEVAPFGIEICTVEPGPTVTGFAAALDMAEPIPVYDGTPAGAVRKGIREGTFPLTGDAGKMADKMIALAGADALPPRMPLGSTAWNNIAAHLDEARALHARQKERAYHCDRPG